MALINCPECGTQVSDKADKCPKCAYPIKAEQINPSKNIEVKKEVVLKNKEGCFLQTMNIGCIIMAIIFGIIVLAIFFLRR